MKLKLLLITIALFVGFGSWGQIAAWDFTAENTGTATSLAEVYNANLDAQNLITRGPGAAPNSANDSFRSTGFQNNGIATSNTDYFQITLSASTGNTLSLSTIDARFEGTATFCVTPGVSNQFAYSLDGSSFTLISSAQLLIGTPASLTQINLSGIAALQNVAAATTITLRYYASGQTTTGGWGFNSLSSGQYGLAIGGTVSPAGITSTKSGPWSDPATWVGNVVPTSSQNAIIAHNITTGAITRNAGTTTTINTGASLAVSNNYTCTGATTDVNGTFQLDNGGWVTGATNFTYGAAAGTLNFNGSGSYVVNNGDVFWPSTISPPFNVNVLQGGVTLNFANRTVAGTFATASGVTLSSSTLTLNGTAQINGGGFFNQSPIYGNASTLKYNTSGIFGRGNEWQALGVGTIGTTAGYPNNIQLSGNTTLNYNNGTPLAKAINGNLTIDSGSIFYMDYGGGASGGILTVAGNIVNNGIFKLGFAVGDDLVLKGNWTNSGTFTPNSRLVTFNGTSAQTITGSTTFDYLTLNNSLGLTLQASSAITVNQTLAFTSGRITIGANNLTVGSSGTITGNSSTNYVVTASTGKLVKQGVGNTATTFPVGFSTTNYTPVTLTNTSGTSDLSVSVKQSVTNAVTDATRIVTLEWGITSSGATTATISPTWVAGSPINQAASFTNTGTGEIGNFTTAYTTYPVTLSTTTTTATGIALQSGTNLIVVGNTGDVNTTPPANDLCVNAIPLTLNATATTGNLKGSTPTAGLTYQPTKKDVWYSFAPSCTGVYAITVTGFTGNVDMDVFTSCPTSGVGTYTSHGSTTTETVSPTLTSGTTYYIRVVGLDATAEKSAFTIQVTNSGTLTLANTGSPASGNISANTTDVVLFGFNVTPSACTTSYNFTQVIISKSGTTTASDLSNFRIVYDADADGVFDVGESSVSGLGIALSNTMTFTISGQAGLSAARRYLLVADVDVLATGGSTFRANITPSTNLTASLTPTGAVTLTATGNIQTIIYNGPEINITNNTPSSIPTGVAASNGYNTIFAATAIGSSATLKTYRIYNLGSTALSVSSVTTSNTEFAVAASTPYSITPGAYVSFTVTFSPLNIGTRTAVISIANNDITNDGALTESPYTFNLEGTGDCPTTTNTITPTSGPEGTEVTITSSNSATNNLTGATVTFNGINATIVSSSATKLVVLVPPLAASGNLVTTNATGCQATNAFTVIDNKANSCQGGTGASDLFISEVTDATFGSLSYIEIYNGTGASVDLTNYSLKFYQDGSSTPYGTATLIGTLNSGQTYVFRTSLTTSFCSSVGGDGSLANQSTPVINGVNFSDGLTPPDDTIEHDYIALFKNSNTKVDSWGIYENQSWAVGLGIGDRGVDFRRKNNVGVPNPDFTATDWDIINWEGSGSGSCNTNDYSDIGTYNFISGPPPSVTKDPSYSWDCKIATSLTVEGQEGYDLSGDTKNLTYLWLVSAPGATSWTEITSTTNGSIYTNFNSATLNISNISNVINYQYYCQIRENTDSCYKASKAVKITDGGTTTWNGAWTNGSPTIDKLAIINANYNTSTVGLDSFSACSVVVNSGKTLTITENEYVKIQNDLTNNGVLTIENNGSLVQVNDYAVNAGNIRYERNTTAGEFDYTYFSSPVAGQTLFAVSPSTKLDKFFSFNAAANDWLQEDTSAIMTIGKGYIIRGIPPPPSPALPPGFYTAPFFGKPNNGIINVPILWDGTSIDGTSNLIGNPYPSAIDADNFLNLNSSVIEGTIYFWTHNTSMQDRNLISGNNTDGTPIAGSGALAYTTDDYASYNLLGGVGTSMAPSGSSGGVNITIPNGKIATGQAFFTTSLTTNATSAAIFNNSMRLSSDTVPAVLDNSRFFKTKNQKTKTTTFEKHRIWLNLTNTQGAFKQTLVGYITDATNEYDNRFDGESFDGNEFVDFYSINQEKNLVIQGRALPFDENDEVPLGFRTTIDGAFTINIDQADGILTNQAVFIEDKLTNTTFDLRSGAYAFTTKSGTFNDRFVLRYTNKTLGTIDVETGDNQVLVSNKNKQIKINSNTETIDKVAVYDLLGRQLFKKDKVSSNELAIPNLVSSQQTLLVKVILQNGQTVTKKIIY